MTERLLALLRDLARSYLQASVYRVVWGLPLPVVIALALLAGWFLVWGG